MKITIEVADNIDLLQVIAQSFSPCGYGVAVHTDYSRKQILCIIAKEEEETK